MPIDPTTVDTETPRTLDGRAYPDHLRAYESLDAEFLPLIRNFGTFTFDELAAHVHDPKIRAAAPRWLSSAEWRGLVERRDVVMSGPRIYAATERGRQQGS